ncbi:hypothetical protein J7T55_004847 [Diaporthe amygdali]|uniref:uncharacterized protein n=1 Tax=Phomopsis amygdali TaxID=1214568 RepID=UPI0022FF1A84|nr:uncharacterized protein J7T55_004847 [Diaporthe amygdali]KAJ0114603.1 hypothetical protein J7T55_004847 [Diaporthe amygdali]
MTASEMKTNPPSALGASTLAISKRVALNTFSGGVTKPLLLGRPNLRLQSASKPSLNQVIAASAENFFQARDR